VTPRQKQGGVALLAAILLVAVATVLAATIAFQSAMAARRGAATLTAEQSVLVAEGAEALAAYLLRKDSNRTMDAPIEEWARPLPPTEIAPGVVLEGSLQELQGRFNLNSLVRKDGSIDNDAVHGLRVLLEMLKLEPKWANEIAGWIDADGNADNEELEDNGTTSQDPPYRTANSVITSASELLALPGFGRERYQRLSPYVVALPPDATLNVCTASPLLLDAMVGADYQQYSGPSSGIVGDRRKACSPSLEDFTAVLRLGPDRNNAAVIDNRIKRIGQTASYFRLTSIVTIGGNEFALYSLLRREPGEGGEGQTKIRVLQRSFTPD
jgi:general secretion pathway protein K